MKQIHKQITLSRTKVVNNILKIWALSSESDRYDWYKEAHEFAKGLTGPDLTLDQACGIVAALSPMKTWDQNKSQAVKLVNTGNCGHMRAFVNKALAISKAIDEAEILRILAGQKIQSFFLNIRYPERAIRLTIDRHALSVALGRWTSPEDYTGMTANQYAFFSDCYRHAAARLNVNPLLVQSATWLVWRRIKKEY